jgi:hypothetical protein
VEVKIGIQNAARELVVDTSDSADAVEKILTAAVESGGVFILADAKGRKVLVPAERIAYVEIGHGVIGQVGFRT